MRRSDLPVKHLMIAGLIAAIGVVVFAGQSHAGSRYCQFYPEDPNCYDLVYGGDSSYQEPTANGGEGDFAGHGLSYLPLPRSKPFVGQVDSCEAAGRELRKFGYRKVRAIECGGKNYSYVAYLGYQRFMVKVNSRSGAIAYEINY